MMHIYYWRRRFHLSRPPNNKVWHQDVTELNHVGMSTWERCLKTLFHSQFGKIWNVQISRNVCMVVIAKGSFPLVFFRKRTRFQRPIEHRKLQGRLTSMSLFPKNVTSHTNRSSKNQHVATCTLQFPNCRGEVTRPKTEECPSWLNIAQGLAE